MKLSTSALAKAKPGDVLHDHKVRGLHARVTAKGASYLLYYRTRDGRERRPKLGDAASMTLPQARTRATEILAEVSRGKDPGADRATVAQLGDRYTREHLSKLKSGPEVIRTLNRDVLPRFGKRRVLSIDNKDMTSLRHDMADRPVHFNRVRALLSSMFNKAEAWELRPRSSNPVTGVPRYPERRRRRYMTVDEARAIGRRLDAEEAQNPASVAFIRLLILTGARRGEIASARWEWLDGNVLRLPDSKTGERDIFLSPAAVEIIQALPQTSGTITGIKSPKKLWEKIRQDAGCQDLRMHDLRHSFASVALSLGLTLGQIGELLGHASTQTTQRYAHLIDEHKRAAVNQTAAAIALRMLP